MPILLSLYPRTGSWGRWILGILDWYSVQGKKYVDLEVKEGCEVLSYVPDMAYKHK